MKIPLIILSMIFFVGSVFAESAPDSTTKPVVITPEQETQRVAERQIVPKFEIRDGTISEAARTLEEWLTQSLKQSKSSPIAITVDQVYFKNKKRVTLLTKNTSVFTICTVLAEQIGAEVVFKENEIHFWAGVWDEID